MVITAHAAPRPESAAAPSAIHPWQSDGDVRGPAAASPRRDLAGAPTSAAAQPSSTSSSASRLQPPFARNSTRGDRR